MNIADLMTTTVKTCRTNDSLHKAAEAMWENDCGCVPVVDEADRVVGMITDRDICMAAYTQEKPLAQMHVSSAMSKDLFSAHERDSVEVAEKLMERTQVRRVPVVDGGGRLKGILSMNDVARHHTTGPKGNGLSGDSIAHTLAAIGERRSPAATSTAKRRPASGQPPL